MPAYAPDSTLRAARAAYFAANGFGDDGGYGKRWEVIKLGPVPIPIRNVPARVKAIRFHDLHHLLTGYTTDLKGEGEIAAWELASGCADKWFAWLINFQGLLLGLMLAHRSTFTAFVRGRHTANLYGREFEESLLDRTVGEVAHELGLCEPLPPPTLTDRTAFVLLSLATVVVHLALIIVLPVVLYRWLAALACS